MAAYGEIPMAAVTRAPGLYGFLVIKVLRQ